MSSHLPQSRSSNMRVMAVTHGCSRFFHNLLNLSRPQLWLFFQNFDKIHIASLQAILQMNCCKLFFLLLVNKIQFILLTDNILLNSLTQRFLPMQVVVWLVLESLHLQYTENFSLLPLSGFFVSDPSYLRLNTLS